MYKAIVVLDIIFSYSLKPLLLSGSNMYLLLVGEDLVIKLD